MQRIIDVGLLTLGVLAVGFAGVNYFKSQDEVQASTSEMIETYEQSLMGQHLDPTAVVNRDGKTDSLLLSRGPTVVLFFSTTCPACERNAPAWASMTRGLAEAVSVVALGVEKLAVMEGWIEQHNVKVTRVAAVQRRGDWGLTAFPTTLVVSSTGEVVAAEIGVLDDVAVDGVRKAIDALLDVEG